MNPNKIVIKADKVLYIIPMNDILYITVKGNYCQVFTDERKFVVRSTLSKMLGGRLKNKMSLLNRSMAFNPKRVTGLTISHMQFDKIHVPLHPIYKMEIAKQPDKKA